MKIFLRQFLFIATTFACSVLLAQDAPKSIEIIKSIDSAKVVKDDLSIRVKRFAEDFIQPIMRGDVYDIEIGNIELLSEYQKNNPIKCDFLDSSDGCHDKASYSRYYDADYFDEEPGSIVKPFDVAAKNYRLRTDTSIIIPFSISLKSDFKKALLEFLETETSGKDVLSYNNLPRIGSAEAYKNEFIQCASKGGTSRCKGLLGRDGGNMDNSTGYPPSFAEPNYVINFFDRRLKKVTYYNLKNYRQELMRARKHRFLTNLCLASREIWASRNKGYAFSQSYLNLSHVQFDDISVTLLNENGDEIHQTVINTNQQADMFQTSSVGYFSKSTIFGQHTYGITQTGNFIFAYDYGSNAVKALYSDYLGHRSLIGHLITDNQRPTSILRCQRMPGLAAEDPAFSIVSNYEYHLIIQLNKNIIPQIASVEIKYLPGNTSRDRMAW